MILVAIRLLGMGFTLSNDDVAEAEIAQLALAAFHSVGCRGWGRVDVMRARQWALFLIGSQYCSWNDDSLVSAKGSESVGYGF